MATQGSFIWNELSTRDPAVSRSFYGELLGWSFEDMDMGEAGTYTIIRHPQGEAGGLMAMPADARHAMPAGWTAYIAVDDVDDRIRAAEELGGKVRMGPVDIPNIGRMCMIEDPTGATVCLMTLLARPA